MDWFSFVYGGNTYFLKAREFSGTSAGAYRLSFGINNGSISIQTSAVNGSNTDTYLELYNASLGLLASNDDYYAPFSLVTYTFTIPPCTDGFEANNTSGTAYNLGITNAWNANMCLTFNDQDGFRFMYNGNTYYIKTRGALATSTGGYNLSLSIANGIGTVQTSLSNGLNTDTYLEPLWGFWLRMMILVEAFFRGLLIPFLPLMFQFVLQEISMMEQLIPCLLQSR